MAEPRQPLAAAPGGASASCPRGTGAAPGGRSWPRRPRCAGSSAAASWSPGDAIHAKFLCILKLFFRIPVQL